jgi:Uma2 family endonuclease
MLQTAKISIQDYHSMIDAGIFPNRRIELLAGDLIELSPETPCHANSNHKLFKYFLTLFAQLADVRSAHPITLSTSEPQPDLVLAKLPETLYDQRHPTPADIYLVIEISYSTLDYDLNYKKKYYAKDKIDEYWIIDLENHRLLVFRNPQAENYLENMEYRMGEVSPLAFPTVKLDVRKLLGN